MPREAVILAARAHLFKPPTKLRDGCLERNFCHRSDHCPLAGLHRGMYRQFSECRSLPDAAGDVGRLEALALPQVQPRDPGLR